MRRKAQLSDAPPSRRHPIITARAAVKDCKSSRHRCEERPTPSTTLHDSRRFASAHSRTRVRPAPARAQAPVGIQTGSPLSRGRAAELSLRGANGSARSARLDDRLRDEAIQVRGKDWIASLTLAMTRPCHCAESPRRSNHTVGRISAASSAISPLSLRGANGSARSARPDDRLRDEAIQVRGRDWIASLALAMTRPCHCAESPRRSNHTVGRISAAPVRAGQRKRLERVKGIEPSS